MLTPPRVWWLSENYSFHCFSVFRHIFSLSICRQYLEYVPTEAATVSRQEDFLLDISLEKFQ